MTDVEVLNFSDVDTDVVMSEAHRQHPEIAALTRWVRDTRPPAVSLLNRDKYAEPKGVFQEFAVASEAVASDDIVSGVIETTERMAFNTVRIECDDEDETDAWRQMMHKLKLETRLREAWRDLYVYSNAYVGVQFGNQSYKIGGKSDSGRKRKRIISNVKAVTGLTMLDPARVLPVGNFMFNNEQLAYLTRDQAEFEAFMRALDDKSFDPILSSMILGRYEPTKADIKLLNEVSGSGLSSSLGTRYTNMFLLNPETSFRLTATRSQYEPFAQVRMKSVFELLDLKRQLRHMDRAHLVAGTSFIIVIKKGSDNFPAQPSEMAALSSQVSMIAKVPILVSDHRLEVEIVTPKMDRTVDASRYNALDGRITSRLFNLFNSGNYASGAAADDSIKLLRMTTKSLESVRNYIRSEFMDNVILPVFERSPQFTHEPRMVFHPHRISFEFDPNMAVYLQDLRDRGDLSRETILGEIDIVEADEAVKRKREAELYDEYFTPVNIFRDRDGDGKPDSENGTSPKLDQKAAGRRGGGRTGGGGLNRDSFRSQPGATTVAPNPDNK